MLTIAAGLGAGPARSDAHKSRTLDRATPARANLRRRRSESVHPEAGAPRSELDQPRLAKFNVQEFRTVRTDGKPDAAEGLWQVSRGQRGFNKGSFKGLMDFADASKTRAEKGADKTRAETSAQE